MRKQYIENNVTVLKHIIFLCTCSMCVLEIEHQFDYHIQTDLLSYQCYSCLETCYLLANFIKILCSFS